MTCIYYKWCFGDWLKPKYYKGTINTWRCITLIDVIKHWITDIYRRYLWLILYIWSTPLSSYSSNFICMYTFVLNLALLFRFEQILIWALKIANIVAYILSSNDTKKSHYSKPNTNLTKSLYRKNILIGTFSWRKKIAMLWSVVNDDNFGKISYTI
jgi:hypothetical protein